jgi:hypothetical protein
MIKQYPKLKTPEQITNWLKEMKLSNYRINIESEWSLKLNGQSNCTVDFFDDVNLTNKGLTHFPINFGMVIGHFYCYGNQFESLEGLPYEVTKNFICDTAPHLQIYQHIPKKMAGDIIGFMGEISDTDLKAITQELKKIEHDGWIEHYCQNPEQRLKLFISDYQESTVIANTEKITLLWSFYESTIDSYLEKIELEQTIENCTLNKNKKVKI